MVVVSPVDSEFTVLVVVARPVESEPIPVDSEATVPLVVARPAEIESTPLDSEATVLLVVVRFVDKLEILLAVVLMPVLNWDTVTASCGAEPSATLVILRNAAELPTDTSESGAVVPVR